MSRPYKVHVVVDVEFGRNILALPADEPAWIADSATNRPVIEAIWKSTDNPGHTEGITSFKYAPESTPEDRFVSIFETIDLHHGEFSHDPPYSEINVVGTKWSSRIEEFLRDFGLSIHKETECGFEAMK